ncbi:Preprotein translocase, gamma subunit [Phaffia rhodozyma]|uniref:Preprotein translocase, gamma subunit n=1 Tax=Phaffia rhodozyma TaxID=264483 RepID=A0A0F7SEE3_PHARH|nr:Preprotein translocase, gamma subunit [Phaffia rhodozyma]
MAEATEKIKEIVELPQNFIKEGSQFLNRCVKPTEKGTSPSIHSTSFFADEEVSRLLTTPFCLSLWLIRSLTEYSQICRAVAMGFFIMGFIGYFVKLIHIPM